MNEKSRACGPAFWVDNGLGLSAFAACLAACDFSLCQRDDAGGNRRRRGRMVADQDD